MAVRGLNHVSISAPDVDESLRFYVDFLGLELVPSPDYGFRVEWLRAGDLQVHLFERPVEAPTHHHLGLTVDDFQGLYLACRERGIVVEMPPFASVTELPDGGAQMYVRDPAGNLVEFDTPDASGIDRSLVPMRRLDDTIPQTAWNLEATLFLGSRAKA
jgi:catechol 2,3-dioxygenase-like lactoylglutathione lyase family enzyme